MIYTCACTVKYDTYENKRDDNYISYLKRAYSKVIKISLVRRRYWIVIAYPPKLLCGQTAYSSENLTLAAKEDNYTELSD